MRCCFITLGCRVNQYESDAMAELLTQAGFEITENPAEADVCIVNTCTVTNIADRKSRQMLSKAHRPQENVPFFRGNTAPPHILPPWCRTKFRQDQIKLLCIS